MNEPEKLIPLHGGYRKLKSFQVAQLAYDVTVRFCDRYIDPPPRRSYGVARPPSPERGGAARRPSRMADQMVQAARSSVQNIAEGSQASGTSKKMELKLTNVARASLEELRLDYEDFLRQRGLAQWLREDARRAELIARRPATADAVAEWARDVHDGRHGQDGRGGQSQGKQKSTESIQSTKSTYAEIAANGALALLAVACSLLNRQLAAQEKAFVEEGGFTERLYRVRSGQRKGRP
jgi:four helix bundle suffix protein